MTCFDCFVTNASIARWWWSTIVQTLVNSLVACATRQPCSWWCLCCERLLCILMIVILIVITFIVFLIVEIVVFALCIVIAVWCLLCNLVCWVGCLGAKGCVDNCVKNGSCDTATVEWNWDPPLQNIPTPQTPDSPSSDTPLALGAFAMRLARRPGRAVPRRRLTEVSELLRLTRWSRMLGLGPRIEVDIPGASTESSGYLRRAIERSAAACGCREGAVGLIVAAGGTIAWLHHGPGVATGRMAEIWMTIAVGVAGAVVGKAVGLVRAHLRLRRSIRRFIATLPDAAAA